jgi:hypothetical protein
VTLTERDGGKPFVPSRPDLDANGREKGKAKDLSCRTRGCFKR